MDAIKVLAEALVEKWGDGWDAEPQAKMLLAALDRAGFEIRRKGSAQSVDTRPRRRPLDAAGVQLSEGRGKLVLESR